MELLLKILGAGAAFTASGYTAATIASIGGWILGTMSKLLDMAMYALVARFDTVIYGSLSPVINQLWTAFRDISNIIIIGMFTFIAISMILGIQSFNTRKMVARVLIIAVLINFSLLFGRIIVETSNFVSRQFYCSMIASAGSDVCTNGNPGAASLLDVANTETGIGLQFMDFLGVRSFWETRDTANRIFAESGGNAIMGRVYAILYGALSFALMIVAALVFGYIIFLLIARCILFIFLLVMSAPAFASYLVPQYGDKYWKMWWNALLRNAIFGPLLMMLLWATFLLSRGLISLGPERSFDKLFATQQQGTGYLALLIFAIVLGLLYASARFANSFSKSIAGFDFSSSMTSTPFAALARFGIAPAMRNFAGRRAAKRALDIDDQIDAEKKVKTKALTDNRPYDNARLARLYKQQGDAEARSKSTFDLLNTKTGQLAGKYLNVSGALLKTSKTNFADTAKARADAAAKTAAGATISKDDAEAAVGERYKMQKETLQEQRRAASEMVQAAESLAERAKNSEGIGQNVENEKTAMKEATERQVQIREEADRQLQQAGLTAEQRDTIVRSRDTRLDEQEQRIRAAHDQVRALQGRAEAIDRNSGLHGARSGLREAEEALSKFDKAVKSEAQGILKKDIEQTQELAGKLAQQSFSGVLSRMVEMTNNDVTSRMARGLTKKKIKAKGVKEQREADMDILKGAGEASEKSGDA